MTTQQVQVDTVINNTPEAVLGYVADVRNRTFFLPSLRSLTHTGGDPAGTNTTWQWTWSLLGIDFVGTGRSLEYQPGKLYSFKTEGGLESTWTYGVAPEGAGTRLHIQVEYKAPDKLLPQLAGSSQARHQAEVERVIGNLKTILDR
jgi:hypothetical protein